MKHIILGIFLSVPLFSTAVFANEVIQFRSPMDKVNYAIGVETVRNFKNQGVKIDLEQVIKGMKDALANQTTIPDKDLRQIMTAFQTELRQRKSKVKSETPIQK
jgi:4-hydroxy-3-methylbut-2-enyl diphosphate reductase IspH